MSSFQIQQEGKGAPVIGALLVETETRKSHFSGCPSLETILQRSESNQNPFYNPAPVPVIDDMGRPALNPREEQSQPFASAEWRM